METSGNIWKQKEMIDRVEVDLWKFFNQASNLRRCRGDLQSNANGT